MRQEKGYLSFNNAQSYLSNVWLTNRRITGIDDLSILVTGITKERAGLLLDFSIITGYWGSDKMVNRCAKCGYKWT